jgi:hypothetical protein
LVPRASTATNQRVGSSNLSGRTISLAVLHVGQVPEVTVFGDEMIATAILTIHTGRMGFEEPRSVSAAVCSK